MPFAKGQSGNPAGRPKGSPNKVTAELRDAVMRSAREAGGENGLVGYLKWLALEQPSSFAPLLGKILPMEVAGDPDNPITMITRIERVIVEPPRPVIEAKPIRALEHDPVH